MVKLPPGTIGVPPRGMALRGDVYIRPHAGGFIVTTWPKKRPTPRNAKEADARSMLQVATIASLYMDAHQTLFSRELSKRTGLAPRDHLMMALFNRVGHWTLRDGRKLYSMASIQDVSALLDTLGQVPGDILVRGKDWWYRLPPGNPGDVLTVDPDGMLTWLPASGGGGGGWTNLAISSVSSGAYWVCGALYRCGAPIVAPYGSLLRVRAIAKRPSATEFRISLTPNMVQSVQAAIQTDNNFVTYRYAAASDVQTLLIGGNIHQMFGGTHVIETALQVGNVGGSHIFSATANQQNLGGQPKTSIISETQVPFAAAGEVQVVLGLSDPTTVDTLHVQYQIERP